MALLSGLDFALVISLPLSFVYTSLTLSSIQYCIFRREEDQKQRCRVAARAALLASLPDDLRRVIGKKK